MRETYDIAGYCRISVDEELDRDNVSIENQKAIIEDFVKEKFPGSSLTFFEDRDRSGYTFEQLLEEQDPAKLDLLQQLDILVDGPFRQEELSLELRFRGSANQRILNVPQSLAQGKAVWETRPRWVGDEIH